MKKYLLIPLLFLPFIVRAEISIDSFSSFQCDGCTVSTSSLSIASQGNDVLIVASAVEANTNPSSSMPITTITYGGQSLTKIRHDELIAGENGRSELWYLLNPITGTQTLSITYTGTIDGNAITAITIKGAAQQAPTFNNGRTLVNDTSSTLSITAPNRSIIIDNAHGRGSGVALTPNTSQTLLSAVTNAGQLRHSTSYKINGSSTDWSFGANDFIQEAVVFGVAPAQVTVRGGKTIVGGSGKTVIKKN